MLTYVLIALNFGIGMTTWFIIEKGHCFRENTKKGIVQVIMCFFISFSCMPVILCVWFLNILSED